MKNKVTKIRAHDSETVDLRYSITHQYDIKALSEFTEEGWDNLVEFIVKPVIERNLRRIDLELKQEGDLGKFTLSMRIALDILNDKMGDISVNDLGFIATVFRDNAQNEEVKTYLNELVQKIWLATKEKGSKKKAKSNPVHLEGN